MEQVHFTDRLQLRPLALHDASRVEELAGDYEIAKTTLNVPHPYPEGSAGAWIESVHAAVAAGEALSFAMTLKGSDELIGVMGLTINPKHKRAELAYWIGKPYWGQGYGTEAARKVIELGFQHFDLNRIFAAAFTANPGSWRIMEKIGMKHEGTHRKHVIKWGEPIDLTFYSILREEYEDQ